MSEKRRIHMLDEIRGFAIICMIFHHTFLDIGDVLGLGWGYLVFNKLCIIQPVFWAIFIIISGMCSRLSRNAVKRGAIVFGFALVITFVTTVVMHLFGFQGAEIYFGILHCLGICMIVAGIAMPLIRKIDYRIGAALCAVLFFFFYGIDDGNLLFGLIKLPAGLYKYNFTAPIGLHNTAFYSADYFPVIPWIFMFLFGAFVGRLALDNRLPEAMYVKRAPFLSLVGRNSLWVYLAHQPIIYAALLLISLFTS